MLREQLGQIVEKDNEVKKVTQELELATQLQHELEQKKVELNEYIGKYRELDARCSALKAANKEKRTRMQTLQQDRKKLDLLTATNKYSVV